jgi:type I restriction enzyme, S subunit
MNNMKTAYKKTEVGLIPEDWEVKELGEIFTFYSTANFSKAEMALFGEVGCVHYGLIHAIENSNYSLSNGIKYYVTKEQAKYEKLQEGDVIMVDASEDLVGLNKSVEVFDLKNKEYVAGLHTFLLRDINSEFVLNFRGLILNSNSIKKQMLKKAVGMKVFGVSKPQLQQVFIPIPPLTEQTAIATALSDADSLIKGLENIIAKKRNIKQGAMQKLLQPKEGWETKSLKELARYRRGSFPQPYGLDKWYDDTNGFPFVQVYDVDENFKLKSETKRRISKDAQDMSVYIAKGSIIITLQGSIGRIAITQYEAYVDRTLLFFESFIVPFDKYFFLLSIFNLFEKEKEKAPGGIIKTITKEALSKFTISYPNIDEQTRIANILSDMNNEIEILETKLEKYKSIKKGMMQNLLTGKIRLI